MNEKFILLEKLGIIIKNKYNNYNNKIIIIDNNELELIKYKNFFLLKKDNNYLYTNLESIDFVKKIENDNFYKYASFILLGDNICCSIIPSINIDYILIIENKILKIKKYYQCLNIDINTIFRINNKIIKKPIEIIKPIINKNLVKINKLYDTISNNINYITIVTNNIVEIPLKFRNITYYEKNNNISLLYLNYIIDNYDNLKENILFIKNFSKFNQNNKLEKIIYSGIIHNIKTELDIKITIDGKRKKQIINKIWGEWQNTHYKNYNLFIKKFIKILPKANFFYSNSNLFYYIPKKNILNRTKKFYIELLDNLQKNKITIEILDIFWFTIFNNP